MRIKGKSQHVIPNDVGWRVVDEANKQVIQHFRTKEEAIEYAHQCALACEGEVLVHTTQCEDTSGLSTVCLPEKECLPSHGFIEISITREECTPRIP